MHNGSPADTNIRVNADRKKTKEKKRQTKTKTIDSLTYFRASQVNKLRMVIEVCTKYLVRPQTTTPIHISSAKHEGAEEGGRGEGSSSRGGGRRGRQAGTDPRGEQPKQKQTKEGGQAT